MPEHSFLEGGALNVFAEGTVSFCFVCFCFPVASPWRDKKREAVNHTFVSQQVSQSCAVLYLFHPLLRVPKSLFGSSTDKQN